LLYTVPKITVGQAYS